MNIKELAKQAGIGFNDGSDLHTTIKRFAELVRQDEREKCSEDYLADCVAAVEAARIEEREACAKLCDADALPPTANAVYWMDMVVANLVRNGVNKHRARELAYHFYTYTTPLENSNG